ncbi:MAG: hypothetical protein M1821_005118 [Bathelium mastoideum]|nr:MAG: hypothetical protein M1821_005118 [Bathelium mastoideum]
MERNMMGGSPPAQRPMQSPSADFSASEIERLVQDRKRFLGHNYVTLGTPLTTTYSGDPRGASAPPATAEETFQTTVETQESKFAAVHTQEGNVALSTDPHSQCCEIHHEQGCKINHGAPRYAGAINQRTGNIECVEVIEDTGTDVNWVSPEIVRQCNFPVLEAADKRHFLDFKGDQYEARQRVKIALVGKTRKTEQTEFFVAPASFPVKGMLVGNQFINSSGHPHNVFLDEPGKVLVMLQKRTTKAEDELIQVTQAQADEKALQIEQKRAKRTQLQFQSHQPHELGQAQASPSSSASDTRTRRG